MWNFFLIPFVNYIGAKDYACFLKGYREKYNEVINFLKTEHGLHPDQVRSTFNEWFSTLSSSNNDEENQQLTLPTYKAYHSNKDFYKYILKELFSTISRCLAKHQTDQKNGGNDIAKENALIELQKALESTTKNWIEAVD